VIGGIKYWGLDHELAAGVVWAPGPLPSTVWVLPESGARSIDAVVVHLPKDPAQFKRPVPARELGLYEVPYVASTPVGWQQVTQARWQYTEVPGQSLAQIDRMIAQHAPELPGPAWRALTLDLQEAVETGAE
jgi:hypothetical protein